MSTAPGDPPAAPTRGTLGLVLGGFAVRQMLGAPRITTEGFTSNGQRVPETRAGRVSTARFFCVHYGFFHLGYAVFIASGSGLPQGMDLWATLAAAAAFAWSTEDGYRRSRAITDAAPLNLGTAMFLPYLRILPMHLTIIFGGVVTRGGGAWTLVLFTLLKTAADVAMHLAEQAIFRRQVAAAAGTTAPR